MGITHVDEARRVTRQAGHLHAHWTMLGQAAGSDTIGARRIEIPAGGWSTPVHDHRGDEEIFFVTQGRGVWWQEPGRTYAIGAGDVIVARAGAGGHTIHASGEGIDLFVFGTRRPASDTDFFRLGLGSLGSGLAAREPGFVDGLPAQFVREAELGPPPLPDQPEPERPRWIRNLDDVAADVSERPRIGRVRRDLGRAAGSVATGLKHVEVTPGKLGCAQHCHSAEEELFIVLAGSGELLLDGQDDVPVRAGQVVARPAATGVAHAFRAGDGGLTYLAYGTREPNDIAYYPRSDKVSLRGIGVIARLERLEYYDGED